MIRLQGAITKRMTAIEEMAGMDVLCSDKTGTLTLNQLTVDKKLIEVFFLFSFTVNRSWWAWDENVLSCTCDVADFQGGG